MDLSKYKTLFVNETLENLEKLGDLLESLEGATSKDRLDTVFRLFHSIKGMSGTMGYTPIFEMSHGLEDLMDQVRQGERSVDAGLLDLLLSGVDRMQRWTHDVEGDRTPLAMDETARHLMQRIGAVLAGGVPEAATAGFSKLSLEADEGDIRVFAEVVDARTDPGVRGFMLYRKLQALGEVKASSPAPKELREGKLHGRMEVVLRSDHDPERIKQFIGLMPEWGNVEVASEATALPAAAEAVEAEGGFDFTGDLDLLAALQEPVSTPAPAVEEPTAAVLRAPPRTIRVRTDWLEGLLARIGDLQLIAERLRAAGSEAALIEDLDQVVGGLRDEILSARLTSMSVLSNRLPRVVRELARQSGKEAAIEVEGAEIAVDRAIIEGLDAPLTHLLRNAIEHGIEPAEDRLAVGKPPCGALRLECLRTQTEIIIELSDDGGGIERAVLIERAVQKGFMDRAGAERAAEEDLTRLICLPGLTSRRRAGALAGRGVGMDAVLDGVRALGGTLEVRSEVGEGTTVRLRLPRTQGLRPLLLVEADGQLFGLPARRVGRSLSLTRTAVEQGRGSEHLMVDGERLPLHDLRHLLGLTPRTRRGALEAVLLKEPPLAVEVDRVLGERESVIKPLDQLLERIDGLMGVTVGPNGMPVFVVDVARFAMTA